MNWIKRRLILALASLMSTLGLNWCLMFLVWKQIRNSSGSFRWADIYNGRLLNRFLYMNNEPKKSKEQSCRRKHLDWMFDRWNQEGCLLFNLQGSSLPLVIHLISQGPDTGWAQGGVAHFSHLDGRGFEASRRWLRGFWRMSQNLLCKSKNWRQFKHLK